MTPGASISSTALHVAIAIALCCACSTNDPNHTSPHEDASAPGLDSGSPHDDPGGSHGDASTPRSDASTGASDGGGDPQGDASDSPSDGGSDAASAPDAEVERADCLDGITDYAARGPFSFEELTVPFIEPLPVQIRVWKPHVPGGCKVPVVHFGNGTAATCSSYTDALEHLASHGFLTLCTESPQVGDGSHCMEAYGTALGRFRDLAAHRLGSAGHGTGATGAILCMQLTEGQLGDSVRIAGFAAQPDNGTGASNGPWMSRFAEVHSPIFMFTGTEDFLVSDTVVQQGFDALDDDTEAYWYEGVGATHVPTPVSFIEEGAVAWFRWKLLDDAAACEHFKAMPAGAVWDFKAQQATVDCP